MSDTSEIISSLSNDEISEELFKLKTSSGANYFDSPPSLEYWDSSIIILAESQCIGICYDGIFGDERPTAYYGASFKEGKLSVDTIFSDDNPRRAVAGCIMLVFGWTE